MELQNLADSELAELSTRLAAMAIPRTSYTVDEVAAITGKSPYTVREWCRLGQVVAHKSGRCGSSLVWRITAGEVARYKDEGLLPIDKDRNTTIRSTSRSRSRRSL